MEKGKCFVKQNKNKRERSIKSKPREGKVARGDKGRFQIKGCRVSKAWKGRLIYIS